MDHLTLQQRSKNMAAIGSGDTKPEMIVRCRLWKRVFRYLVNHTDYNHARRRVLINRRRVLFARRRVLINRRQVLINRRRVLLTRWRLANFLWRGESLFHGIDRMSMEILEKLYILR